MSDIAVKPLPLSHAKHSHPNYAQFISFQITSASSVHRMLGIGEGEEDAIRPDVGSVRENDDNVLIVGDVVDDVHSSDMVEDLSRSRIHSAVLANGKELLDIDKESPANDRTGVSEKREA